MPCTLDAELLPRRGFFTGNACFLLATAACLGCIQQFNFLYYGTTYSTDSRHAAELASLRAPAYCDCSDRSTPKVQTVGLVTVG